MKKCKTCGLIVPQGHGHKSKQQYCSVKCYQNRNRPSREIIIELLNKTDNVSTTAGLLGTDKQCLYRYIKQYNIQRKFEYI